MIVTATGSAPATVELLGPAEINAGASDSVTALADGTPAPTYSLGVVAGTAVVVVDRSDDGSTVRHRARQRRDVVLLRGHGHQRQRVQLKPGHHGQRHPAVRADLGQRGQWELDGLREHLLRGSHGQRQPCRHLRGPLSTPAPPNWLTIDPTTGDLTGTEPDNGETSFSYAVTATNGSGSATSATVTVQVTPDTSPTTVTVSGPSTITAGTNYQATTTSDGNPVSTYSFAASPAPPAWLNIDPNSGAVTGTEPRTGRDVVLLCGGRHERLRLGHQPDSVRPGLQRGPRASTVTVTGPTTVTVGDAYDATTASDGNLSDTFSFASSPAAPFWLSIDPGTGDVSGIEPDNGESSFTYAVVSTNGAGPATSPTVTVNITSTPAFTADRPPTSIRPGVLFNYQFQAGGLPDAPTYSLDAPQAPWLTIDPTTGTVSGTEPDNGETSFDFYVTATNDEGSTVDGPFAVSVPVAPVFAQGSPPTSAFTGDVYSYRFQASGDDQPAAYSLQTSADWMSINPQTGQIAGVVPQDGEASFTYSVVATDDGAATTSGPFTITIDQGPEFESRPPRPPRRLEAPIRTSSPPPGNPISRPTRSLASGDPSWLSINSTTGTISGVEPHNGETSFSYSVAGTNSVGSTTAGPFTVQVTTLPAFTAYVPPSSVGSRWELHLSVRGDGSTRFHRRPHLRPGVGGTVLAEHRPHDGHPYGHRAERRRSDVRLLGERLQQHRYVNGGPLHGFRELGADLHRRQPADVDRHGLRLLRLHLPRERHPRRSHLFALVRVAVLADNQPFDGRGQRCRAGVDVTVHVLRHRHQHPGIGHRRSVHCRLRTADD